VPAANDSEARDPRGRGPNALAVVGVVGLFVVAIVAIPFLGGGSLIRGMGNSANRIYTNELTDEVAEAIAKAPAVPRVTDEELGATYLAIRDRATAGDLDAALVLFRIAQIQRAAK
jgi:predicted PurR-regulated permease PerM